MLPRAIRKTAGAAVPLECYCEEDCFYTSWVGRKHPEPSRPDASPSVGSDPARPNRRRTVQVENMRRFKLGPNVASLAAN